MAGDASAGHHNSDVARDDPARLRKRSVAIAGHRTSVSIENAFWTELQRIARQRGVSIGALITRIDRERTGNLSGALRVFVLTQLQRAGGRDPSTSEDRA